MATPASKNRKTSLRAHFSLTVSDQGFSNNRKNGGIPVFSFRVTRAPARDKGIKPVSLSDSPAGDKDESHDEDQRHDENKKHDEDKRHNKDKRYNENKRQNTDERQGEGESNLDEH